MGGYSSKSSDEKLTSNISYYITLANAAQALDKDPVSPYNKARGSASMGRLLMYSSGDLHPPSAQLTQLAMPCRTAEDKQYQSLNATNATIISSSSSSSAATAATAASVISKHMTYSERLSLLMLMGKSSSSGSYQQSKSTTNAKAGGATVDSAVNDVVKTRGIGISTAGSSSSSSSRRAVLPNAFEVAAMAGKSVASGMTLLSNASTASTAPAVPAAPSCQPSADDDRDLASAEIVEVITTDNCMGRGVRGEIMNHDSSFSEVLQMAASHYFPASYAPLITTQQTAGSSSMMRLQQQQQQQQLNVLNDASYDGSTTCSSHSTNSTLHMQQEQITGVTGVTYPANPATTSLASPTRRIYQSALTSSECSTSVSAIDVGGNSGKSSYRSQGRCDLLSSSGGDLLPLSALAGSSPPSAVGVVGGGSISSSRRSPSNTSKYSKLLTSTRSLPESVLSQLLLSHDQEMTSFLHAAAADDDDEPPGCRMICNQMMRSDDDPARLESVPEVSNAKSDYPGNNYNNQSLQSQQEAASFSRLYSGGNSSTGTASITTSSSTALWSSGTFGNDRWSIRQGSSGRRSSTVVPLMMMSNDPSLILSSPVVTSIRSSAEATSSPTGCGLVAASMIMQSNPSRQADVYYREDITARHRGIISQQVEDNEDYDEDSGLNYADESSEVIAIIHEVHTSDDYVAEMQQRRLHQSAEHHLFVRGGSRDNKSFKEY
ncbi:hypothetical protein CEUSTIGMA_g3849.t1 [Chlamydomonas eustigma]|uniref:Uncharacterized protein n=1 Tax=Chlamydomonas eustigma TaxID=1157962 RepID=A0A250WZY2_9CHLO|nr:hypothetical protein CEUSTIGMA_g3849.t1 [Chlamydomonas eustigma]|eukprot:GAX76404.1 hypothetical protein CEUSTIGMA_g3849.t1 [Chlamydomonas eustigma]